MKLKIELTVKNFELRAITGLKGCRFISHQRRKKKIVRMVKQHGKNGCSLLDIGCGSGGIAVELSHHGYNVSGSIWSLCGFKKL